jgi:hypothetical protein
MAMTFPTKKTMTAPCVPMGHPTFFANMMHPQTFDIELMPPEREDQDEEDEEYYEDNNYVNHPPSDYGGSDVQMADPNGYINVGVVPTTGPEPHLTGRIVTFPNWIQACLLCMG